MLKGSYQLAQDLEQAFNQFGASMMTDDFACKLMAFLLQMGGGNEAVVMHGGLHTGIAIAAQKLNLKGGEIPNAALLDLFNKYNKELEQDIINKRETPWLTEIYDRYDLKAAPKPKAKKKKK